MVNMKIFVVVIMIFVANTNGILTSDILKTLSEFYQDIVLRKPRLFFSKFHKGVSAFLYGNLDVVHF